MGFDEDISGSAKLRELLLDPGVKVLVWLPSPLCQRAVAALLRLKVGSFVVLGTAEAASLAVMKAAQDPDSHHLFIASSPLGLPWRQVQNIVVMCLNNPAAAVSGFANVRAAGLAVAVDWELVQHGAKVADGLSGLAAELFGLIVSSPVEEAA
jgi:hypothetical protein